MLTKINGVLLDEAANVPIGFDVDGPVVPVMGCQAFLKNKRAACRHEDLDDVECLELHGAKVGVPQTHVRA